MELKLSNNLALVATESHVKRMSPRMWMPLHQARLLTLRLLPKPQLLKKAEHFRLNSGSTELTHIISTMVSRFGIYPSQAAMLQREQWNYLPWSLLFPVALTYRASFCHVAKTLQPRNLIQYLLKAALFLKQFHSFSARGLWRETRVNCEGRRRTRVGQGRLCSCVPGRGRG